MNVWYVNFFGADTHAVLPYTQYLHRFPAYLQQLTMESNGKHVRWDGTPVTCHTGEVFWGEPGTNGQHAFYQLMHQGSVVVPAVFIAFANTSNPFVDEGQDVHELFLGNFLAQTKALAFGPFSSPLPTPPTPSSMRARMCTSCSWVTSSPRPRPLHSARRPMRSAPRARPSRSSLLACSRATVPRFLAQTKALAFGKTADEVRAEGTPEQIVPARVFEGNRPTTSIFGDTLTPFALGELIAVYEHITFVQGTVWGIDSYDQWGVELGKQLAKQITPAFHDDALGELIAVYEHITFVQGTVWGIDSYDQWGVELGKQLAKQITPAFHDDEALSQQDASTKAPFVQGTVWGIDSYDQWGVELGKQLAKQITPAFHDDEALSQQDASTKALIEFYRATRR